MSAEPTLATGVARDPSGVAPDRTGRDGLPPGVAVSLRGLRKRYGRIDAVDGVDLDIRRGELLGLIGHNGAGKSTLFKLMLGLIAPTAGTIRFAVPAGGPTAGAASTGVAAGPSNREARRGIGYLPENVVLWDNLSGLETLNFFAKLKQVPVQSCLPMLERVGLAEAARRPVREYSKGMRQRLGFAQALLGRPRVLFLDEPTTGLDPHAIRQFWQTLAVLRAQGLTLVLSSHSLADMQARVDRVAVMANGRLQALGSVASLRLRHDLPVTIDLRLEGAGREAALRLIASLPGETPTVTSTDEGLHILCPRASKVALLQSLGRLGPQLIDVQVIEPSLEDLFVDMARSGAPQEAR